MSGKASPAICVLVLLVASRGVSYAAPYVLVSSGAHDFDLRSPKVFWHTAARCIPSPDHGPPIGAEEPELMHRIASSGGTARTLFEADEARPADVCNPYHVNSNLIADADFLYWVDDSGLVRLSTNANVGDPVELWSGSVTGGEDERRAELAQDADSIFAKTFNGLQTRIWEVRKSDGQTTLRRTFMSMASGLSTDGKYVYWLRGTDLRRASFGELSLIVTIETGVHAYHAEGRRSGIPPFPSTENVYVAKGHRIYKYDNVTAQTTGPIYTSQDSSARIYSLTSYGGGSLISPGTGLFFLERRPYEDPDPPHFINYNQYVVRTGRGGGSPAFLYVRQGAGPGVVDVLHLTTDGTHLYWQDSDRVMRLPNNAAAMPDIDLYTFGMEVTQGIQDLANSVDLIENRRTFVRLYAASTIASGSIAGVTARLRGYANGHNALGTLWPVNSVGTKITVHNDPDRFDVNHSFLFELPWSWTTAGTLTLEAELNPTRAPIETDYSDNFRSVGPLSFKPSPRFEPQFIIWRYEVNGELFSPRNVEDILATYSWFRRVYPLASAPGFADNPTPGFRPRDRIVYDAALGMMVTRSHPICALILAADRQSLCASEYAKARMDAWKISSGDIWTVYYGMMETHPDFWVRGSASGLTATGPCGPAWSWETDTTFGDWYAGHEIGHCLGRGHPNEGAGECGHDPADPSYPYEDGYIGGSLNPTVEGFDASEVSHDYRPLDREIWRDIMTYCDNLWVSDYTYDAFYAMMMALEQLGGGATQKTGAGRRDKDAGFAGNQVGVFGMIRLDTGEAVIAHMERMDPTVLPPVVQRGDYSVQLIGEGDTVLDERLLKLEEDDESGGLLWTFSVVLPFAAGSTEARVVRLEDDVIIAREAISEHPPEITAFDLQHGPEPVRGDVTLSWSATDADGDSLSFDILASHDGGSTFEPLQFSLTELSTKVDTDVLPGGECVLRLVASDGVHIAQEDSESFLISDKPPEPYVNLPVDGLRVQYGQLVNFVGGARDARDGSVSGRNLVWNLGRSSLGRGSMLSKDDLPIGTHRIQLTATNSAGLSASADVTVIVHDDLSVPGPTLSVVPHQVGWQVAPGRSSPQTATVRVSNVGAGTVRWTAKETAPWLTLSTTSGTAPSAITLTGNPAGMEPSSTVQTVVVIERENDPAQSIPVRVTLSVGCTHCDDGMTTGPVFRRGDTTGEGTVDISDGIFLFDYLFLGGRAPECLTASDANASGIVDISDGIYILGYLFLGGAAPPAPFPGCGSDSSGSGLPCQTQPGCR